MALGDVGMFLPKESQYKTPGAYDKMLQAEADKRASYLASMDQFYANLDEAQRQLNETLAFKTETRDLELDWAKEQFGQELAFRREELAAQKEYNEAMLGLREKELNLTYGEEDSFESFVDRQKLWKMVSEKQQADIEATQTAAESLRPTTVAPRRLTQEELVPTSGEIGLPGYQGTEGWYQQVTPENAPEGAWQ